MLQQRLEGQREIARYYVRPDRQIGSRAQQRYRFLSPSNEKSCSNGQLVETTLLKRFRHQVQWFERRGRHCRTRTSGRRSRTSMPNQLALLHFFRHVSRQKATKRDAQYEKETTSAVPVFVARASRTLFVEFKSLASLVPKCPLRTSVPIATHNIHTTHTQHPHSCLRDPTRPAMQSVAMSHPPAGNPLAELLATRL